MTYQLRQQLSKLFRPDYQRYPCCRHERCHYNHRLDYLLVMWYTISMYHFLRDWPQAPSELQMSSLELVAWLVIYILVIAMQEHVFRKWILPLVIPPARSFFSSCYLVVQREVIPPAMSFLNPCFLVVKREVRLVSSLQFLPVLGQAF